MMDHVLDTASLTGPDEKPKFIKKSQSSEVVPAEVTGGPSDMDVLCGKSINLVCQLAGTPPLKLVWRQSRNEISTENARYEIDNTPTSSRLTIRDSGPNDSNCYTLQVSNSAGVDQFSVSVRIVDVPDAPGRPHAAISIGNSVAVSWYGCTYDGGCKVKSYLLEQSEVASGSYRRDWQLVTSSKCTTYTVNDLKENSRYIFRVKAENDHGLGKPSNESEQILIPALVSKNGADDSDDEGETGEFVKYEPVTIKYDEKFINRYEIQEKLGQGRFGKVHRVMDRRNGRAYAAKIMRALKAKDKAAVQMEIEIMNSLRHPKLVQLIDAYSHGREVTMVMDLVAGGELFERVIDEDFELTEAACIKYMRQICEGVDFMHENMILHLDLKPENIMCINKTGTQIKIIDFGLARKFNTNEVIRVMFGTPEFVAPEVINYDAIGFQTDMWSVGVICYILLSGLSPFSGDNDNETLSNITAERWDFDDESFDKISPDAKDFISHLLVKSIKTRYTVEKALKHKWLRKDTMDQMLTSKLDTRNLKRFLARRKWQKTGNAVRALGRLASLARISSKKSSPGGGTEQRESGFLSALKAQLVRENENEQMSERRKPQFVSTFDDVEVIEGSAARFQCVITGKPDAELMWFKDGEAIKESRHYRMSYDEDDTCTLLISDVTETDEAEYTCKAVNCCGETEHSAELIVITPGV